MVVLKMQCGNGYACVRGDGAILPMSNKQDEVVDVRCVSSALHQTSTTKKITTGASDVVLEYKTRHLSRVLHLLYHLAAASDRNH